MLHPLEQKIVSLRRRVRRMAAVYGLSVVAAILLATVAVLGRSTICCDSRTAACGSSSRSCAGRAGVELLRRFLASTLFARLRDADLALRVERRFPRLNDRLLSADGVPAPVGRRSDGRLGRAPPGRDCPRRGRNPSGSIFPPCSIGVRRSRAALLLAAACVLASILVCSTPADRADCRGPVGQSAGQHRLAADDPPDDSPAGRAGRPRAGLRDRGGRCPRRPGCRRRSAFSIASTEPDGGIGRGD